jgi:TRAP-type C4-dicarboxylate transport system permease small subunit
MRIVSGTAMTRTFIAIVEGLSRLFALVAVLLLIASMLVICQMVFARYIFRWPTIWQTDFVVYAATAAIFIGAPYVLMTKGHVGVDVVETMAKPRLRRGLRYLGSVFGLSFCAMMFVASWMYFHEAWEEGWTSSSIWRIPLWIPTLPMPVGFGLLCLQYVAEILKLKDVEP